MSDRPPNPQPQDETPLDPRALQERADWLDEVEQMAIDEGRVSDSEITGGDANNPPSAEEVIRRAPVDPDDISLDELPDDVPLES